MVELGIDVQGRGWGEGKMITIPDYLGVSPRNNRAARIWYTLINEAS
jgi:hypothetical protein